MDSDSEEKTYPMYLERCSYRSLQQMAKAMSLPSNVKKIHLIQLIHAKKFRPQNEVEDLAQKIRMERKQVTVARKVKYVPKKSLQQSSEISSTSNTKSPPLSATPKRVTRIVTRYSPEGRPVRTRYSPEGRLGKYRRQGNCRRLLNPVGAASDRVLRSFKRPSYVLNNTVIGIIKSSNSESGNDPTLNMNSDTYRKVDVATHVTRRAEWRGGDLVPVKNVRKPLARKRQRTLSGIYPLNKSEVKIPNVIVRRPDGTLSKINAIIQKPFTQQNRNIRNQITSARIPNLSEIFQIDEKAYKENEYTEYYHKKIRAEQVRQKTQVYKDDNNVYRIVDESHSYKNLAETQSYKNLAQTQTYKKVCETQSFKNFSEIEPYKNVIESRTYRNLSETQAYNKLPDTQSYKNLAENRSYKNVADNRLYKNMVDTHSYKNVTDTQPYKNVCETQPYKNLTETQVYNNLIEKPMYRNFNETQGYNNTEETIYRNLDERSVYKPTDNVPVYRNFETQLYRDLNETQVYGNMEGHEIARDAQVYRNVGEVQFYKGMESSMVDNPVYKDSDIYNFDDAQICRVGDAQVYRNGDINQCLENQWNRSMDENHLYRSRGENQLYRNMEDRPVFRSNEERPYKNTNQRLPRIGDVFSQCHTLYRDVTQPIFVQVGSEPKICQPPQIETSNGHTLELLYNLKNILLSHRTLMPVPSTAATRCVYSTPLITTAKAQPSIAAATDENNIASLRECGMEVETIPRVHEFFRNFTCDEDTVSLGSVSPDHTNVTIPEMVEDALELISQDGDYMERIGMDVRMQCILCSWAGPKIILEYHIRKEHPSQIEEQGREWSASFCLGELLGGTSPVWRSRVADSGRRLYAVTAAYRQPDCFMAAIANLSETETPQIGRITIYNKVTGEPYVWEGEIQPLSPHMPYENENSCLTVELSKLDLLPNSANLKLVNGELVAKSPGKVIVGQPELNNIYIMVCVQLLN